MENRISTTRWDNFVTRINDFLPQSPYIRYSVAILAVAVGIFLKFGQNAVANTPQASPTPFITVTSSVLVAAWFGGLGPGLLATFLAALCGNYFFIEPVNSFGVKTLNDSINLLLFVFYGVLVSLLCEILRRALHQSRLEISQRRLFEGQIREQSERFQVTLASIGDAVIATDVKSRVIFMNGIAESLTGWSMAEAQNRDLEEIFKIVNEETRAPVENPVVRVLRENHVVGLANHTMLINRDGREIAIDDSGSPIRDTAGQTIGVVLVFRDVTEVKATENRERFLTEVTRLLSSSLDYDLILERLARLSVPVLADYCLIDVFDEENNSLRRAAFAHTNPEKEEIMADIQSRYSPDLKSNWGISNVIQTGEPSFYPKIDDEVLVKAAQNEEHLAALRKLASHSGLSVSLKVRDRVLGVLTLAYSESDREYTEDNLSFAQDVARRAALALDNARLYRQQQLNQIRLSYLAEASKVLSSSLDYEVTLKTVAQLAVPTLADWCTVYLVEEDGQIGTAPGRKRPTQVALAHTDPAKVEWARQLQRDFDSKLPYNPDGPTGMPNVLRTGQPELIPVITNELFEAVVSDQEILQILREINFSSAMSVPLIANERVLGVISFTMTESGRHYGQADLAVAQELAQRAALAVQNARLYQEARKAIAARDEFLSIAAHELKTPVTSLRGFAQLLVRQLDRHDALDPERIRRAFSVVDEQSQKLTRLVERLLDLSRLEGGKLRLEPETTDLIPLIEVVVKAAQSETTRHHLEFTAPAGPVLVKVDPLRFEQVLTNLVDNAVKYSPDGGPVVVSLDRPSPVQVRLSVRDRGIGIAPQYREGIFNPFYQAHSGTFAGMGLGLYISQQIVELHSGRIEVEHPAEGGTNFIITLPVGDQ